jgi:hypothetical protein
VQGWNRVGLNTVVSRVRGENPALVSCRVSECKTRNTGVRVPCSHRFEEKLPEHGPIRALLVTLRIQNTVGSCRAVAVFNCLNTINTPSTRHVRVGNRPWLNHFKLKVYPKLVTQPRR